MRSEKVMALVCGSLLFFALAAACGKVGPDGNGENSSSDDGRVAVTSVSVTRTDLQLTVGEGFHMGAKVLPSNATNPRVSWSSSNKTVATVEEGTGQISALSEGSATITVTTQDGGFTSSCSLTVSAKPDQPDKPDQPVVTDPGTPAPYGALPSKGQVQWQRQELLMFYHYGQATFSGWDGENATCNGRPWSEELLLKNYAPKTIDAEQWVRTAQENGFREVILTAKHHDGFCLWDNPESTTDIANEACSNHTDVVKAVSDACAKYGVNFGVYLSPWDRMIEAAGYSTARYESMYKSALTSLMKNYGTVTEMWFDGNHAGNFDWESVNRTVLDINPDCVIFSNGGPGCRWVGNEQGEAGETNWSTLDISGRYLSPSNLPGDWGYYLSEGDKGAASWCPAECDFSIQQIGDHNGWFYGKSDYRKDAVDLMDLYYKSVGRNSVFLMNVPPSDEGVIAPEEVKLIEDFTAMRTAVFSEDLADGATVTASSTRGNNLPKYGPDFTLDGDFDTYFCTDDDVTSVELVYELQGEKTFNRVMLQEYIPLGQRIESFDIEVRVDGQWKSWGRGAKTTVGYKRIILGSSVKASAVRVKVNSSLACPLLSTFALYNDTVSGL